MRTLPAMIVPALLALALAIPAAASPPAGSAGARGTRAAEAAVQKRIPRSLTQNRKAACRATGRLRWRCRWVASRRYRGGALLRCRARSTVSGPRRRVRSSRRRCRRVARRASPKAVIPARPAAPPSRPAPPPAPPRGRAPLFGFNDNAIRAGLISASDDAELTARVGANVHRVTLDWRWLEPHRGTFQWASYDAIYREMTARGVRPVFILLFTPSWAIDPATPCDQWARDCRLPPGRAFDEDWRRLASAVATRYPRAAGIEIWNEPNETTFWQPAPDARRYAELLRSAHAAVKAVAPGMRVIGGGPSNRQHAESGSLTQADFLRDMYAAGAAGRMDALSLHPYPWSLSLDLTRRSIRQARAARDAAGDAGVPLWITEIGLSTTGTDPRYAFTHHQQAQGLAAIYRELAGMDDVEAIMVHTLLGPPEISAIRGHGYPVLNADRSPKPAYCALGALRGVAACPTSGG